MAVLPEVLLGCSFHCKVCQELTEPESEELTSGWENEFLMPQNELIPSQTGASSSEQKLRVVWLVAGRSFKDVSLSCIQLSDRRVHDTSFC